MLTILALSQLIVKQFQVALRFSEEAHEIYPNVVDGM